MCVCVCVCVCVISAAALVQPPGSVEEPMLTPSRSGHYFDGTLYGMTTAEPPLMPTMGRDV